MNIEDSFAKSGEQMVSIRVTRSSRGVIFQVKTHALIEEFFKNQGRGVEPVANFHRDWHKLKTSESALSVYNLGIDPGVAQGPYGSYCINRPGYPLLLSDGLKESTVNISFLRLVGISEGDGVSFEIRGAFTLKYLESLVDQVINLCRQFYIDFLKPIDLLVTVNTQRN